MKFKINVIIEREEFSEGRTFRFKTEKSYKRWLAKISSNPTLRIFSHGKVSKKIKLDYSQIENVEVDGIDTRDYPKFCDAFISYADYKGKPMTESQLDTLNDDGSFIHEQVWKRLY